MLEKWLWEERKRQEALWLWEQSIMAGGASLIAGLDEAGRGPLAGPVVAAAVILPHGLFLPRLNDSKQVPARHRETLADALKKVSLSWAIGLASEVEIDAYNILQATLLAMRRALDGLTVRPEHLIIDALRLEGVPLLQTPLIGGDRLSASVAAASILAKVHRDALMAELDSQYPQYGFARHKGYPTAEHLDALRLYGPSPVHRLTFHGVKKIEFS